MHRRVGGCGIHVDGGASAVKMHVEGEFLVPKARVLDALSNALGGRTIGEAVVPEAKIRLAQRGGPCG